ncbi:MAG: succinyl-diaminopimelate desuccinylase [Pseudomonadota bacterium]
MTQEQYCQQCHLTYPHVDASGPQVAAELTQNLIRIPSLTPIQPDISAPASCTLNYLEGYLTRFGANCTRLVFEGGHPKWGYPVDNLYAEWTFGQSQKHLCFLGHTDVVAPGDKDLWSENPYSAVLKDGWIYGRGATDMKGAVATFCAAVTQDIEALKNRACKLSLLITTDEEWAAVNGTRKVLEWLHNENKQIDAFIVGEPSSHDDLGSHIKIGRRGSLCGTLEALGIQGHAAYHDLFDNPNRALSLASAILNAHIWDHDNPHFPATQFEIIACTAGDFGTTAIVPGKAKALWNIRFTPEYSVSELIKTLKACLENPPHWAQSHPDFNKLKNITIHANTDTAALPYYSPPSHLAEIALQVTEKVTHQMPRLDGSGGTTDGRFVQNFFPNAQIIELGLPEKGGKINGALPFDYGNRGGMHQIDERCSVSDIEILYKCYQGIIEKYFDE